MPRGLKFVTMGAAILSVVKDRISLLPSPRGPRPSLSVSLLRGALCSAELFDLLPIALYPPTHMLIAVRLDELPSSQKPQIARDPGQLLPLWGRLLHFLHDV